MPATSDIREHMEGFELSMRVSDGVPAANLEPDAQRLLPGRGGCGICGTREMEDVVRPPAPVASMRAFSAAALRRALDALSRHQPMNAVTGSTHAAAWADVDGNILLAREDVGRHNALDKLVGALATAGIQPGGGFAVVTSRASYELAMKAAQAGIPLLAAISAPTTLAIALAESTGLCLIGFAREGNCGVYAHAGRLLRQERPSPGASRHPLPPGEREQRSASE